ncbi:peptide MFS transporter [Nanchangia anserum]|nr:oligopeptide:H+ symporter [Nanchangia anserum]
MSSQTRNTDTAFFGHPIGLMTLFTTELWERFSYYGMRAILLYFLTDTYLNGGLAIDEPTGKAVVATYSSSVFLTSVIGGWISDRLFGPRKAALYGGIIIILGHLCLALPLGATAYLGIIFVAVGSGVFKPNPTVMLGELYSRTDSRRDSGFSIFYLGINLGSFFSPLVVGLARSWGGYHAGFAVAAVGMAVALAFYVHGRKHLDETADEVPDPISPQERTALLSKLGIVIGLLVILWVLVKVLMHDSVLLTTVTTLNFLALAMPVVYFAVMLRSPKVTKPERSRLLAFIPLFIAAALFWMVFEQAASSMSAFAENSTDLHVGSLTINPEWFQSVNPLGIIILSGVFAAMWQKLGSRPSTPTKFAIGLGLASASFIFLGLMAKAYEGGLAPVWILTLTYVIQTVGELCLSPVGLAAASLLAPQAFKSQGMALWLLASAFGQSIASLIFANMQHLSQANEFLLFAAIAGAFTLILVCLIPWINRRIAEGFAAEA